MASPCIGGANLVRFAQSHIFPLAYGSGGKEALRGSHAFITLAHSWIALRPQPVTPA